MDTLKLKLLLGRRVRACFALLLVVSPAWAALPPASSNRYLGDVKTLTAPRMQGRGDGTRGLSRAGKYIEKTFRDLGLQPAGTHSYTQPFTVTTGARLKSRNQLEVRFGKNIQALKLNTDYVPLSFSSVGTFSGPLVFAGYGASADEFQYDDYAHLDVKDKIVVLLRYEPERFAEKAGKQGPTLHSNLITKAINARNHGAKAVILVNGERPGEEDLLLRFGAQAGPEDAGILLLQVKNSAVEEWFQAAGKSLYDLQKKINSEQKPQSFAFPESVQASLRVDIEHTHATVNNILGYLPGKSDEYVIIGAHYDHLGRGDAHSLAPAQIGQIHPGADDNASGTAGMLELARIFAQSKTQLQRGILFMAFAGEELGLLGSADWVKEPTRSPDKAVAMLNMDMIGRIKDFKLYVGGVGTGSSFDALVKEVAARYPFKIEYSAGGYAASGPYLICCPGNSFAVFLFRPALGLSQAFRYLGEN
jgi:hypothetical protein